MPLPPQLQFPRIVLSRLTIVLVGTLVAILALVGLLSITRDTPVSFVLPVEPDDRPPAIAEPEFARTMELFTGLHLESGNTVQQLLNGDGTYPVLWRDLRAAQRSITVQMYYSLPSTVADTLQAILVERARAGVRVLLLLDAFGSQNLGEEWQKALTDAGVQVRLLRPLHWWTLHKAANRSHVRVVVVDGRIGYTGGFGLADYWLGSGRRKDEWREANVRFTGPAVQALQATFAIGWAEATGVLLTGQLLNPRNSAFHAPTAGVAPTDTDSSGATPPATGAVQAPADTVPAIRTAVAGLLFTQPTEGSTGAERFFALTIAGAQKRLWIANSYFVPNDDFRRLLAQAAKRGVDVRILTVSHQTDVITTRFAARAHYESLLRNGVRIWEYQPTMMHAKTIVADGVFGTIGSINFDNRSMAFNNESALVVLDETFAGEMERAFEEDLRHSKQILLPEFRRRGIGQRILEQGATLLSRLL
jgi:cardiolipin synthase